MFSLDDVPSGFGISSPVPIADGIVLTGDTADAPTAAETFQPQTITVFGGWISNAMAPALTIITVSRGLLRSEMNWLITMMRTTQNTLTMVINTEPGQLTRKKLSETGPHIRMLLRSNSATEKLKAKRCIVTARG